MKRNLRVTDMTTDSTVRTSVLEYIVAAIKKKWILHHMCARLHSCSDKRNRNGIIYMIAVIMTSGYDIVYMITVIKRYGHGVIYMITVLILGYDMIWHDVVHMIWMTYMLCETCVMMVLFTELRLTPRNIFFRQLQGCLMSHVEHRLTGWCFKLPHPHPLHICIIYKTSDEHKTRICMICFGSTNSVWLYGYGYV